MSGGQDWAHEMIYPDGQPLRDSHGHHHAARCPKCEQIMRYIKRLPEGEQVRCGHCQYMEEITGEYSA